MTRILYTDRSRSQAYRRCPRQRYHEYSAGPGGLGIVPKRKSIHLAIGLGFHAGAEVLLTRAMNGVDFSDSAAALDAENNAVQAGLLELAKWTAAGVEVDLQEQPEKKAGGAQIVDPAEKDLRSNQLHFSRVQDQQTREQADSPIVIDFGGAPDWSFSPAEQELLAQAIIDPPEPNERLRSAAAKFSEQTFQGGSFADPIFPSSASPADAESAALAEIEIHTAANEARDSGVDDYLRLELAALVEGMIRGYARRRLKPLTDEMGILEVEREGSWLLAKWDDADRNDQGGPVCAKCGHAKSYHAVPDLDFPKDRVWADEICDQSQAELETTTARELHWMSRHDGLLLERSSNSLYLLSFKTTGAWDRRKKADAEIDMQGLSEAVDVERRLGEAWDRLQVVGEEDFMRRDADRIYELVSPRIAQWLALQPSPPKILGVRYEYILKGARREDKNQPAGSSRRWAQDSPLIRAYLSRGITQEDDRWAPKYEWQDIAGKDKRVDYRSWKKQAVWEQMTMRAWIDRLDRRDFWPGEDGFDQAGNPMDVLGDQFVPPVTVWRSEDDMRDLLEQLEAQEVGVALAVDEVRRAEQEGEGAKRSALNRLFPQNRSACSYPSLCQFRPICYGGEDIRRDPLNNSELYAIREVNHPIEMGE